MANVILRDPLGKHGAKTVRVGSSFERTLRLLGWLSEEPMDVLPAAPVPDPIPEPTLVTPEPSLTYEDPSSLTLPELAEEMEQRDLQAEETVPFKRGRGRPRKDSYFRRDLTAEGN